VRQSLGDIQNWLRLNLGGGKGLTIELGCWVKETLAKNNKTMGRKGIPSQCSSWGCCSAAGRGGWVKNAIMRE
jgi:hypothetical protein